MGLKKGYIQVYTGNGKGKTTAALGQGLRACGHNLEVCMVQFLKTDDSGELCSIPLLRGNFRVFRFESEKGFLWTLSPKQKELLKSEICTAMEFVKKVMKGYEYDILILDEIAAVLSNGLYSTREFLKIIKGKPDAMEIILTGRDMPEAVLKIADLVTEMREVKHYFNEGVTARAGIEK